MQTAHFFSQGRLVTHGRWHTAQQFTGRSGKYVPVKETVAGFKEILSGAVDDLPEQAFYMVGNIEEAKQAAAKLKAQAS